MSQPALRAVPSDGPGSTEPPASSPNPRSAPRARATEVLPTNRVKFDLQLAVLKAFARLSGGKRPVDSEQIAGSLNISVNTAALSNAFFVESGWLERVGRGKYVATEATLAYNRRMEFAATPSAVELLAEPARSSSWYWRALEPAISGGRLSRNELLVILSTEANTTEEHRPQLEMLLQWLEFLGMIRIDGDSVVANQAVAQPDEDLLGARTEPEGETEPPMRPGQSSADRADERRPSTTRGGSSGDVVIAFSTDLKLTGEDLAALSPEQIKALFEAVGTVAALTQRQ